MKFVKVFPFLMEFTVELGRSKYAYMKQLEKNVWMHYMIVEKNIGLEVAIDSGGGSLVLVTEEKQGALWRSDLLQAECE